jgi:hypothetical protein
MVEINAGKNNTGLGLMSRHLLPTLKNNILDRRLGVYIFRLPYSCYDHDFILLSLYTKLSHH